MFDPKQFSQLINDTLVNLDPALCSRAAVQLLSGTAAQESRFGTYLAQINGPALGVFQMEPATEQDIWDNYLRWRPHRQDDVARATGLKWPMLDTLHAPNATAGENGTGSLHLRGNLLYQIAMARIHYLRCPEPLPAADDVPAMAAYWKQHYNTPLGRGTEREFVENYHRYVSKF